MFEVSVKSDGVLALLDQIAPKVRAALKPVVRSAAEAIQSEARQLATDGPLKEKTGRYARRIKQRVYDSRKGVFGKVYSRDPRAPLFEFGGTQDPRDILPDARKVLHFAGSAGDVFAAIVHRPAVTYAPRPTIHAAFDEKKGQIAADIEETGREATRVF